MTLTCPACNAQEIELAGDNGAEYPETRVEFYECDACGNEWREVLSA